MNKTKYINIGVLLIVIFLFMFSFIEITGATTYYISAIGNDNTGDGSYNKPFAGLDYVISRSDIGNGIYESERDIIIIQDGIYNSGSMLTQVNIINKNYITIKSNGSVIIDHPHSPFFIWQNSTQIIIDGIFINDSSFGYFFFNNNFIINNSCGKYSPSVGIRFGRDYKCSPGAAGYSNQILNSVFSNNGDKPNGGHTGISIGNTNTTAWENRFIIKNCTCNNNGEDGIQLAGALDNSHADEDHIAAYIEVYNCTLNNNGEDGIDLKAARYIRFYNNILINNKIHGIVLHSPENSGNDVGSFECAIYNNLVKNSKSWGICILDGDITRGYTKNIFFNNIIINGYRPGFFTYSNLNIFGDKIFHNTMYGQKTKTGDSNTSIWTAGFGITCRNNHQNVTNNLIFGNIKPGFHINDDATKINNYHDGIEVTNNTIIIDPKFVNVINDDFHLQSDSSVINNSNGTIIFTLAEVINYKILMGSDLPIDIYGTTIDKDGNIRSNRSHFDIGAYEYIPSIFNSTPLNHINDTNWINHMWNSGIGNVTNSYNVSINNIWYNITDKYYNNTNLSSHEWSNISLCAYNSSSIGSLSNYITQNVQVPNKEIIITNINNINEMVGANIYVDCNAIDLDGDDPIFSCNRTDLFVNFNLITGQGNWTATSGTHYVDFGVSDGWGSTSNYTIIMDIQEQNYIPPIPINLMYTTN